MHSSSVLTGLEVVCPGCGTRTSARERLPFSCPNASLSVDCDHVLQIPLGADADLGSAGELNPFLRFRRQSWLWRSAGAMGVADERYSALVRALDEAVRTVDGVGFEYTPLSFSSELGVWIKDETGNVSGSHKGRHLFATALYLEILGELGIGTRDQPLAIASCGNAALAAAVVARAANRKLTVFVTPHAHPVILARLRDLGASLQTCERSPGDPPGDPCYLRFREAVAAGAIPFSCQGTDNATALIGGYTLGLELVASMQPMDAVVVQVGGGVLASAVFQSLQWAVAVRLLERLPRLFAVQTANAHPLRLAWERYRARQTTFGDARDHAAFHRRDYMEPWPDVPASVAEGILDDETYDWRAILAALDESSGDVVCVSEERLGEARGQAQTETAIAVSHTGAAGFAGVLELRERGVLSEDDSTLVLFTGVER